MLEVALRRLEEELRRHREHRELERHGARRRRRGGRVGAGWSAASSARPEWRVIAPPVASSIPAIPSAPACSARPVVAQHTASEIRSLNECAPSATSAADPLSRPMASLNAESSTLVSAESAVTDVGVIRRASPRTREPRRSDGRRFGATQRRLA